MTTSEVRIALAAAFRDFIRNWRTFAGVELLVAAVAFMRLMLLVNLFSEYIWLVSFSRGLARLDDPRAADWKTNRKDAGTYVKNRIQQNRLRRR